MRQILSAVENSRKPFENVLSLVFQTHGLLTLLMRCPHKVDLIIYARHKQPVFSTACDWAACDGLEIPGEYL